MNIILLLIWFVLSILVGFLGFIAIPVIANRLPIERRSQIGDWYQGLALAAFGRVLCTITPHNDVMWLSTTWNDNYQTERAVEDGDNKDHRDSRGVVSRCRGTPFAFALSDSELLVHPLDAVIGRAYRERDEAGDKWRDIPVQRRVQTDGGKENVKTEYMKSYNAHVHISDKPAAVDMQDARPVFAESHEPNDVEKTEEDVKKSQHGFKSHSLVSMMMLVLACGAGALMAWIIYSNTGQTESAVTVPIQLAASMGVGV